MRKRESFPPLSVINPNLAWVSAEIDSLILEWTEWNQTVQLLANSEDSEDYDLQTCTDALKDGRENLNRHEILREKTLVFLRNHFEGSDFIFSKWPDHPHESNTSRLSARVPTWLHRLEIIKASMDYVLVPDGFWQGQAKRFLEKLSDSTAEGAVDVAKSFLKNPLNN